MKPKELEEGENRLKQDDFLGALECFLNIRAGHLLALVHIDTGVGRIRDVQTLDLDGDGGSEIGVLTWTGQLFVLSHGGSKEALDFTDSTGAAARGQSFCFHSGKAQQPRVAIAARSALGSKVTIHGPVTKHGSATKHYTLLDTLTHLGQRSVFHLAALPTKLLVSTGREIHRFEAVEYQFRDTCESPSDDIVRLCTEPKLSIAPGEPVEPELFLGITRRGSLELFRNAARGVSFQEELAQEESIVDATIADVEWDGVAEFVACTANGRVLVYERGRPQPKYTYTFFDELAAVSCHILTGDQRVEILAGGSLGYLYALEVNEERRLVEKWRLRLAGPITTLHTFVSGTQTRLFVGLATGEFSLWILVSRTALKALVYRAYTSQLRSDRTALRAFFTVSKSPEVLRYGLDELARDLDASELIAWLQAIEQPSCRLVILEKLGDFFSRFSGNPEFVGWSTTFIQQLYEQHQDVSTCERINQALEQMVRSSANSSEEILELTKIFQERLRESRLTKPHRIAWLRRHAGEHDELNEVRGELEKLSRKRLDLLGQVNTPGGVRSLHGSPDGMHVISTNLLHRSVHLLAVREMRVLRTLELREPPVAHLWTGPHQREHWVANGSSLIQYQEDFTEVQRDSMAGRLTCTAVAAHPLGTIRFIGMEEDRLVIRRNGHVDEEVPLHSIPVRLAVDSHAGGIDLYILTAADSLRVLKNVASRLPGGQAGWRTDLVCKVPGAVGVLDLLITPGPERAVVVVKQDTLHVLRRDGTRWSEAEIEVPPQITCAAAGYFESKLGTVLAVGTRNKSLHFTSLEGKLLREAFFSDLPTALCVMPREHSPREQAGAKFVVGFEHGLICHYEYLDDVAMESLRGECNLDRAYLEHWRRLTWPCKLTLIGIARQGRLTQERLLSALDEKVQALLAAAGSLEAALADLVEKGVVDGKAEACSRYFFVTDARYSLWIKAHQDELSVVAEHADEVFGGVSFAALTLVDNELSRLDALGWFFSLWPMSADKWDGLVRLSGYRAQIVAAEEMTARARWVGRYQDELYGRLGVEVVDRGRTVGGAFSIFTTRLPFIRFNGFNRICTVLVYAPITAAQEAATLLSAIQAVSPRPEIVLVFAAGDKQFLARSYALDSLSIVILDDEDLKAIWRAPSPDEQFLDGLCPQLDLSTLSPFTIAGPVNESMFYGRRNDVRGILSSVPQRNGRNVAVIGPRRIGKTSLLHRVRAEINKRGDCRAVYLDCSSRRGFEDLCRVILEQIGPTAANRGSTGFVQEVQARCQAGKYRLVLLLDEVDGLLGSTESESEPDCAGFLETLRSLSNEANVGIIFAGYADLYFQMKDLQSPLFNLAEPLELAELDGESARALITEQLGPLFEIGHAAIDMILEKTGRYPNFIQFCCLELVKLKGRGDRVIRENDVRTVTRGKPFYEFVIAAYLQGMDEEVRAFLYAIVSHFDPALRHIVLDTAQYTSSERSRHAARQNKFILGESFTPFEIHGILEHVGLSITGDELDIFMKKLVLASVIKPGAGKQYRFVLADLPGLVTQNTEVEEWIVRFLEQLAQKLDPQNST